MAKARRVVVVPPPPAPPAGAMSRAVAARLVVNALLGVALLAWLRAHTDWGDAVGSLLALGGILSWVAFVGRLFDDDRQKQIRRFLADWLFESPKAWAVTAVLLVLLLLTLGVGTVEVASVQGGDAQFRVYPAGSREPPQDAAERVAAGGRRRFPFLIPPFGQMELMVRVDGLPTREFAVRPWWRAGGPLRVAVPGSFLRPVVLVTVHQDLHGLAATVPYALWVEVNGAMVHRGEYVGKGRRAALLGPAEFVHDLEWVSGSDAVRVARADRTFDKALDDQFPPDAHSIELNAGDEFQAVLTNKDGEMVASSRVVRVRWPEARERVLQLVVLRR